MQIQCPHCQAVLVVSGDAPKFCSQCGSAVGEPVRGQETAHADLDRTLPPRTDSGSRTEDGDETIAVGLQPRDPDPPELGEIGSYRLLRHLGEGGMGTVFEAVHQETGQAVALKLLQRSLLTTDDAVERFKRESRIAASINHPRSTFVYEANEHHGQFYITMELMTGGTLKDVVNQEGSLPVGRAVDYILDVIEGLQVAHDAGIVHRDLKPANVFIDHDGRVKIGDFGLAKSFFAESSLTQTGTFMGTPQYAAPEQLRAGKVDERTDIYALGGTLFFLLTNRAPFEGGAAQVIASIASETPPRVHELDNEIPRELSRIIAQTLEKDPARRQQNLNELRTALLPYSTRGASLADVGRRMAAYFLDLLFAGILAGIFSQLVTFMSLLVMGDSTSGQFNAMQIIAVSAQCVAIVVYFALLEWRYGRALGKWLMGMRVIGADSERPRLHQSVFRALLIPGISWVINTMPALFIEMGPESYGSLDSVLRMVATTQGFALLSWIPVLILISTARASNGFQGLHGTLTGTRVVRLAGVLVSERIQDVSLTAPSTPQQPVSFGNLHAIGEFSTNSDTRVYLATDPALNREVFVFAGPTGLGQFDGDRQAVKRPARLRVLDEGADESSRWHVTEAVRGTPLVDVVCNQRCTWPKLLPVFRELFMELERGAQDGTLPAVLTPEQLWIERTGRVKLVDVPFASNHQSNLDPEKNTIARAIRMASLLLTHCCDRVSVPHHVVQFQQQLAEAEPTIETLEWANHELTEFVDRPATWQWDDRLGLMAVAFGLETPAYAVAALLAAILGFSIFGDATLPFGLTILGISGAFSFALGYFLNGSPSMRVSQVTINRANRNQRASQFFSGLRNLVTWLPFLLLIVLGCCVLQIQMASGDDGQTTTLTLVRLMLAMLPVFGWLVVSLALALLWPARGIADLIANTSLVRS